MIVLPLTLGLMCLVLVCRFGRAGLMRLATARLQGGAFALLACLAQVLSVLTQQQRLPLLLLSATSLAAFCWLNRHRAGIALAALGIALNVAVMVANNGAMPINSANFERMSGFAVTPGSALHLSKDRVLEDDVAALPWLGDRLLLPGPLARLAVWSIGDFLLLAGVGRLLWYTMKGTDHDQRNLWDQAAAC